MNNGNPTHLTIAQCRSTILTVLKRMLKLTETNDGLIELNDRKVGLCSLVPTYITIHFRGDDDLSRRVEDIWRMNRDRLFKLWPKYSGDDRYPIPSLTGNDHLHAYTRCRYHFGWTKYGKLRIELLKYMVKCYQDMVWLDASQAPATGTLRICSECNYTMQLIEPGKWRCRKCKAIEPKPTQAPAVKLVECDACPGSSGCVEVCMKAPRLKGTMEIACNLAAELDGMPTPP